MNKHFKLLFYTSLIIGNCFLFSCNKKPSSVTLTFDAQGGIITGENKLDVSYGSKWSDISSKAPLPFKDGYTYTCWSKDKITPCSENFEFKENTTLYALYTEVKVDFKHDSWANIIATSNSGEDGFQALKNKYGKSTFIGEKRTINIGGTNYDAKVIGEGDLSKNNVQHDSLANEQNKICALTFEIESNIPIYNSAYSNPINTYGCSFARSSCSSIFDAIFDNDLKNGIREVRKKTFIGGSNAKNKRVIDYNEKLFMLSYEEINGGSGNAPKKEGKPYQYYLNVDKNKRNKNIWLRTPNNNNDKSAYYIDDNGDLKTGSAYDETHGILPCFAIGSVVKNESSFANLTWDNINQEIIANGLQGLKNKYNNGESLVGLLHPIKVGDNNYSVRVIGEEQDYIDSMHYGTLTFKFETSITESKTKYHSSTNDWENNVFIKNKLNEIKNKLPNDLKSILNKTLKYSIAGGTNKDYIAPYPTYDFTLPSASELGVVSNQSLSIKEEGNTYSFYKDAENLNDLNNRRSVSTSTYLRSPDINTTINAISLNNSGEPSLTKVDTELPLAPIFSIGSSNIVSTSISYCSSSILSANPTTFVKKNERYNTTLSLNRISHTEIEDHCEIIGDDIKVVVFGVDSNNNEKMQILSCQSVLSSDNVGFTYINNNLTISSSNEIAYKYSFDKIFNINLVPEATIKDTWLTINDVVTNNKSKVNDYYSVGALSKSFTINSNTYRARIIGINADADKDKAIMPLTFMFTSPIVDSNTKYYDVTFHSNFKDSTLKSDYNTYKTSIQDSIGCTIKAIKKETNTYDFSSESTDSDEEVSVFPLSTQEINYKNKYKYFGNSSNIIRSQLSYNDNSLSFLLRETSKSSSSNNLVFRKIDNTGLISQIEIEDNTKTSPISNILPCFCI